MENHDKLYTQFKNASEKIEATSFLNSAKIWDKIEGKLDTKVLKKQNHLWKKIAVAASILLVLSILVMIILPWVAY